MTLYNFQPRFVEAIQSGTKRHTIRGIRKYPAKVGDVLHLYVGLRHSGARRIARVRCTRVEEITIRRDRARNVHVTIDGTKLANDEKEQLARADGFRSFDDMLLFWTTPRNRLPFFGHVIHWTTLED